MDKKVYTLSKVNCRDCCTTSYDIIGVFDDYKLLNRYCKKNKITLNKFVLDSDNDFIAQEFILNTI